MTDNRKEYLKQYYKDNREKRNAYSREWRRRNPDKVRASQKKYDSSEKGAIRSLKAAIKKERITKDDEKLFEATILTSLRTLKACGWEFTKYDTL